MLNSSDVAGEGTYGCVHNPQLFCKNQQVQNINKVSKLMNKKNAKKEFNEYSVVESVDPDEKFYLGKPTLCSPEINNYNKQSAYKCKKLKKNDNDIVNNLKKYVLLIMEDGGENLNDFSKTMSAKSVSPTTKNEMEFFWLEAHRMILGLKVYLENGIIHHDLKAQNMVYNQKKGRINFIDFGLMTEKKKIISESKKSNYGFASFHWSFPLEIEFLNKNDYNSVSSNGDKIIKKIVNDLKTNHNSKVSNALYTFLDFTSTNTSFLNRDKRFIECLKDFNETLLTQMNNTEKDYKNFVEKVVNTIDSYGVSLGFLNVLKNTHKFIDKQFADDLSMLFLDMVNFNLNNRIDVDTALKRYENILEKNGILSKYKKHFVNNELKNSSSIPIKINNIINSINNKSISIISNKIKIKIKKNPHILDPKPICPSDKEINPKTNRCVKLCKSGYSRDQNFNCKKNKTMKSSRNTSLKEEKKCPSDKEINPKTNRCVKLCKSGYSRDQNFHCKKDKISKKTFSKTSKKTSKKCPSEKDLNPKTNRCVKKCNLGFKRDQNFHCKKNKTNKKNKSYSTSQYGTPMSLSHNWGMQYKSKS
jgi:hypothetical protein